jgi:hypothetical protein
MTRSDHFSPITAREAAMLQARGPVCSVTFTILPQVG